MTATAGEAGVERVRGLTLEMTSWPSVTESLGEAEFAPRLHALLADTPLFRAHPEDLFAFDSHGDPARKNLCAFVRGPGTDCILLVGHYDTVSTGNYGALEPLCHDPEALRSALCDELSAQAGLNGRDRLMLDDLRSGDFLPGRGILDMKSGLAAGIAALERFAALEDRPGNLLFVATPDEENRSRGMIALRDALPGLARSLGITIRGALNLDCAGDDGDGTAGRVVFLGSVGKFSPFAYVIGRPTHAGFAFDGSSAHLVASAILREMESNTDLCDEADGELSPPPVCLQAGDLRHGYEVTTPGACWLSFNWLTHRRSATEILGEFAALAGKAQDEALALQERRATAYATRQGRAARPQPRGRVLQFGELRDMAEAQGGKAAIGRLDALAAELADTADPLAISRRLVQETVREAGLTGPAVVVGLSTLHYPRVHISDHGPAGERFREVLRSALGRVERRHGTTIGTAQYFPGISDMSFLGHRPDDADSRLLRDATPAAAFVDLPPDEILAFPVVNLGPWGRDYHQRGERLYTPYAFDVLPEAILECASALLSEPEDVT